MSVTTLRNSLVQHLIISFAEHASEDPLSVPTNHNSSNQNLTNHNASFYLERIIFLAVIISALHSLLILFILIVFNPVWLSPEK